MRLTLVSILTLCRNENSKTQGHSFAHIAPSERRHNVTHGDDSVWGGAFGPGGGGGGGISARARERLRARTGL